MRFVYATRPLPKLEFATADQHEAIPADAEVFAVCEGALTIRQQNAQSIRPLSEQEQAALEQLIIESQNSEALVHTTQGKYQGFIRRLLSRLFSI